MRTTRWKKRAQGEYRSRLYYGFVDGKWVCGADVEHLREGAWTSVTCARMPELAELCWPEMRDAVLWHGMDLRRASRAALVAFRDALCRCGLGSLYQSELNKVMGQSRRALEADAWVVVA